MLLAGGAFHLVEPTLQNGQFLNGTCRFLALAEIISKKSGHSGWLVPLNGKHP